MKARIVAISEYVTGTCTVGAILFVVLGTLGVTP